MWIRCEGHILFLNGFGFRTYILFLLGFDISNLFGKKFILLFSNYIVDGMLFMVTK